jgi:Lon protease-like protein
MNERQEISLFPLKSVMFPGGRLKLQIFEQRYIDLVKQSLRMNSGFGICLLKDGEEAIRPGTTQTVHRIGTYVHIIDWDQLGNRLLGITVKGVQKVTVNDYWQVDSGLLMANVNYSSVDKLGKEKIELDEQFQQLADLLHNLEQHPLVEDMNLDIDYNNLWDLGWRLSELMPITPDKKQQLLELDDPWERIRTIEQWVADLANGH